MQHSVVSKSCLNSIQSGWFETRPTVNKTALKRPWSHSFDAKKKSVF